MSKSHKDKANYFRYDDNKETLAPNIKKMINVLYIHQAGYRYNNSRRTMAYMKHKINGMSRAKEQDNLFKREKDYLF